MDFGESAEHSLLREAVAGVAASYGHAYWVDKARRHEFTWDIWKELGGLGFLGVNLPIEFGGGGGGMTELSIVAEEVSAAGCPLLLILVSPAIAGMVVARFGTELQKAEWLPGISDGSCIVCLALTEPDAGSNTHRISTRAVRQGDEYVISGQKYYTTGFEAGNFVMVLARVESRGTKGPDDSGGLSLFMVPTGAAGLTAQPISVEVVEPELQWTLFFEDVRVPAGYRIGHEGEGLRELFVGLNPERIISAAMTAGVSRYAIAKASRYARERKVWGVPIGAHQGVAHPLAERAIQAETARLMLQKASWMYDTSDDMKVVGEVANMAKFVNSEACLAVLDTAIQVHGGNGFATETGLATLWGVVRLQKTAPLSREMVLNHYAQGTLDLPRSY